MSKKEKMKKLVPVFINIALHEAMREVLIKWWSSADNFDIDEIKKSKDIFDEMWANYLKGNVNP